MSISKILCILAATLLILACIGGESADEKAEREIAQREAVEAAYQDGYENGRADYGQNEKYYEQGYEQAKHDTARSAYRYLYEEYGIDDDGIIDYCIEQPSPTR